MREAMSTKERILDAALTLFAENGYNGTSVEQIAGIVGIKAPSLYKHYKGKEDILNALIDSAEARYEEVFGSEEHIGKIPESIEEFVKVTMGRISFTMRDPVIRKTRMFLVQEQFRNERISEVTTMHQLKEDDPALLSAELTAPAVLQIARADRQPQYLEEVLESTEKHIRHFCKVYMMDEKEVSR